MSDSAHLGEALAALADAALTDGDLPGMCQRLCQGAVELLGVAGAEVVLIDDLGGSRAGNVEDGTPIQTVPLRAGDRLVGHIALHDDGPPSAEREVLAQTLADLAGALAWRVRAHDQDRMLAVQLQQALDSRVVIEQAKGILSARLGIAVDQAFHILRYAARDRRAPLRAIAAKIVDGSLMLDAQRRKDPTARPPHLRQPLTASATGA